MASAPTSDVPTIPLNNGVEIPQLGFGVFQIKPEETAEATRTALEIGYRHIDTAQMYGNEKGVGEAVRDSGLDRGEIFVTSKVNNNRLDRDAMLASFDESLAALGFDYLDLLLIHWPLPAVSDYVARWKAMEEIYASGRVKAIGVSNFQPPHLRNLFAASDVRPAVNQVEVSPFLVQDEIRAFDADHEIVTEAWSPIARGKVADDPVIRGIAEQLGRTPAQVTLRWHVQRGDVVFPKSVKRSRMEENFAIFDFELDESQMAAISALDRGERTGPNPDEFNWIPRELDMRSSGPHRVTAVLRTAPRPGAVPTPLSRFVAPARRPPAPTRHDTASRLSCFSAYSVCILRIHVDPTRLAGAPRARSPPRLPAAGGVRRGDRGDLAAERRAGLHHPGPARTGRLRGAGRLSGRRRPHRLPDHRPRPRRGAAPGSPRRSAPRRPPATSWPSSSPWRSRRPASTSSPSSRPSGRRPRRRCRS